MSDEQAVGHVPLTLFHLVPTISGLLGPSGTEQLLQPFASYFGPPGNQ